MHKSAQMPGRSSLLPPTVPHIWEIATGRIAAILRGHEGSVNYAEFSPDGRWIVTASSDKIARVWEVASGKTVAVLRGHAETVETAGFSSNGLQIVTGSDDTTAKVWDTSNGKLLATLQGHEYWVTRARFSPDGLRVFTASPDKPRGCGTRLVAGCYRRCRAMICGRDLDISPNGELIISASATDSALLWEASTGKLLATLRAHSGPVTRCDLAPVHRLLTASDDQTVRVWEMPGVLASAPGGWSAFLKFFARRQLDASGELSDPPMEMVQRYRAEAISGLSHQDTKFSNIALWFLASPTNRSSRPGDSRRIELVADSLIAPDAAESDLQARTIFPPFTRSFIWLLPDREKRK